LECWHLKLSAL